MMRLRLAKVDAVSEIFHVGFELLVEVLDVDMKCRQRGVEWQVVAGVQGMFGMFEEQIRSLR